MLPPATVSWCLQSLEGTCWALVSPLNLEGKVSNHLSPWVPQTMTPDVPIQARGPNLVSLVFSRASLRPLNMTHGTRSKASLLMTPRMLLGKTHVPWKSLLEATRNLLQESERPDWSFSRVSPDIFGWGTWRHGGKCRSSAWGNEQLDQGQWKRLQRTGGSHRSKGELGLYWRLGCRQWGKFSMVA